MCWFVNNMALFVSREFLVVEVHKEVG